MSRPHEYFTLEEANLLVPTLEFYFQQVAGMFAKMSSAQHILLHHGARRIGGGLTVPDAPACIELRDQYFELCEQFDRILETIVAHGVEIIDPLAGIVHFKSWWDEDTLTIRWQFGEPAAYFWHPPWDDPENESYSTPLPNKSQRDIALH